MQNISPNQANKYMPVTLCSNCHTNDASPEIYRNIIQGGNRPFNKRLFFCSFDCEEDYEWNAENDMSQEDFNDILGFMRKKKENK